MGPLSRLSVVVTRTRDQASSLVDRLRALGATPIEVPLIAIEPPADGGAALRVALGGVATYDWLVLTSPNGVDAVVETSREALAWAPVAVVGPATAARLEAAGFEAALIPERFVAEGLVDAFPAPPDDRPGRVLVAQAEGARPALVDGLRRRGWEVDAVTAYRTVAATIDDGARQRVASADVVTFTSSSTVEHFVAAFGTAAVPPIVACIGPITADTAREAGLDVTLVAEPHTIDGLIDALVAYRAAEERRR